MLQIRCYERWDMSFAAKWIWDLLNMIQLFTSSYDAWKMMAFDALLLFSHSVVSDSWHHELQHANLPCPSPSPGDCSNSYPLSKWCHPTISSPVVPFSSRFQSFPASGSFLMSQPFASGPKYGIFSLSISPSKKYSGFIFFRMNWLDLLVVQGTLKSLTQHSKKASILCSAPLWSNCHIHTWQLEKP